jgi:hypothetical protein
MCLGLLDNFPCASLSTAPWRLLMSGDINPSSLNLGTTWKRLVNFTLRPLYPQGKNPQYPLNMRLGGPYLLGTIWRRKKSAIPIGFPTTISLSSVQFRHYIRWTWVMGRRIWLCFSILFTVFLKRNSLCFFFTHTHTQTFIFATTILLYDMHNENFAFGTSHIWFWYAAVNQFANASDF